MGRWFAGFLLKDDKEVIIHGRDEKKLLEIGKQFGIATTTSISTAVKGADIVLISVPIDAFEDVVKELQPCLNQDQIVIDIIRGIQEHLRVQMREIVIRSKTILPRSLEFHRKIFEAVKRGKPNAANKQMYSHILDIEKEMYKILEHKDSE